MKIRYLINRFVNFVRPKPRMVPLTVSQILDARSGLDVVERFNDLYYSSGIPEMKWRGIPLGKNPCDLWMIFNLLQQLKPRVIVETGTNYGGSAACFADIAKLFGIACTVITVDYNPKWSFEPLEKNIISVVGYSTDVAVVEKVRRHVADIVGKEPGHVIVMLDSDHSAANVREELRLYADLVTLGSYLIVEDTNVNGHPSALQHGPGPWEATEEFLNQRREFQVDRDCQRYLLTFNPNGWLRRVV